MTIEKETADRILNLIGMLFIFGLGFVVGLIVRGIFT